jgi:hypothetical protein
MSSFLMRAPVVFGLACGIGVAGTSKWQQNEKLTIREVKVLTADPLCWQRVDVRIDLSGTYQTPFDPEQIAVDALVRTPSGKQMTVPAFFYQDYERQVRGSRDGTTREIMNAVEPPGWRVRFMPAEPGKYTVRIHAKDRAGEVTSAATDFEVGPGQGRGYIRISKKDPHYFEFDDGTPYFAIGENMVEGPLSEYYRWIPRLAENGGNYSRLWIGHPYFALELGTMGEYRLDNAWRLDQVMELSEEHGIYQKMCIDWIRHITPRGEPRKQFDLEDYAYSVSNGGPCHNMREFFALAEARRLFKNRLRYTVARWGYSTNVLGWELWNEINAVDREVRNDRALILDWNREMCRYLKSVDPWQHLTTNSLGSTGIWPEMWEMKENEFAQMHGYYYFSEEMERNAKDMAGFMIKWLKEVDHYNKPFLFAEFGVIRERPEIRALCDRDQHGVHLHNGLWAPLAYGAAGTGALWWWGSYVDPKNLYYHFLPVARFVKGIPWTTAGFEKAEVETDRENLRALGLRGKPISILWLQNKEHTWWNVIHDKPITPVENAKATISRMPPGRYRIEYWDTYRGLVTRSTNVVAEGGALSIAIPTLEKDMAIKIRGAR